MTWSTGPPDPDCTNMICGNCKQPNHHRRKDCPMGHLDTGPTCDHCGNKGHTSAQCRKKTRDDAFKKTAPVNSVKPAEERAELLSKLASLEAKEHNSATNYVRSGEEVRRIPDSDSVALSELHRVMPQDLGDDKALPGQEPYCPSHVLAQEGRDDSDPDQVFNEALYKRFEEDLRCLMCLTSGHGQQEFDIPERPTKSGLPTRPTEEKRKETVVSNKSDMTEDLTVFKKQIDLTDISSAPSSCPAIMDILATSEVTTPLTAGALGRWLDAVVPPENPDDLSDAFKQLTARNKQLEADLQAYKDIYPMPPSITNLQETLGNMVKITTSQKGKSWSETSGLSVAAPPVRGNTLDLDNIIKEVNTTLPDQCDSTAIIKEGAVVMSPSATKITSAPSAPIYAVGDTKPDKDTQSVVLSLGDGMGGTAIPWLEQQGFIKTNHEKNLFYHSERDLSLLVYTDDIVIDGKRTQVDWIFNLMDERFGCKSVEDITTDTSLGGAVVMGPSAEKIISAPSAPIYNVGDTEPDKGTQFVVLSLCDGMGCAAISMQEAGLPITRYCAVEMNNRARTIASHASPKTDHFPGVDHSLANNIDDITEKTIMAFPRDSIKWLVAGPECSDFSKLRLLPPSEYFVKERQKQARDSGGRYIPVKSPREGLNGPKGKTFRTCIKIWGWVKKHHPNCAYLFENVAFNDMDSDWREVCEALGEPLIIDSHDFSATSRRRAWWHNDPALKNDPDQGMKGLDPIDPQTCMDPGRKVQTYEAKGKTKVRTIGASWGGNPQCPEQQSRRKVWVHDTAHPGQPQELRVTEAEKLHGLEPGLTSAPGMTPLDRLKAIGGGWDIRIATQLFKALHQSPPKPVCYAADPKVMEKARGLPAKLTKGHLKAIEDYKELDPSKLSTDLKAFYAALLQHPDAPRAAKTNMVLHGSIIDSGASKHVCKSLEIEDGTRSTRLCGFDGSQRWTEGKGYLPIQTLTQGGNSVHLDINDADQYSGAETNLLSMGKLVIQDDWVIHCSRGETYAILPDGERVDLYFNEEQVLCLKHDLRTGQGALRIPGSSTTFLTRYADVRAGSHKRNPPQSQCKAISSYNAYTALQPQAEYDGQGLRIDDGQEW